MERKTWGRGSKLRTLAWATVAGSALATPILANPFWNGKSHSKASEPRLHSLGQSNPAPPSAPQEVPVIVPAAGQMLAQQSGVQHQLELLYQQNGRQMPQMAVPSYQQPNTQQVRPQQPGMQQPVYQQPVYQQPNHQQPRFQQPGFQQPTYQQPQYQQPAPQQPLLQYPSYQGQSAPTQRTAYPQQGRQTAEKRGFLERIFSPLRKERMPSGPPADPGMSYPKGPGGPSLSNGNSQPGYAPPSAPPVIPGAPPAVPKEPPGLLQTPPEAIAISEPLKNGFLPPGPDGDTSVPVVTAPQQIPAINSFAAPNTVPTPAARPTAITAAPTMASPSTATQLAVPPTPAASTGNESEVSARQQVFDLQEAAEDELGGFEFEDEMDAVLQPQSTAATPSVAAELSAPAPAASQAATQTPVVQAPVTPPTAEEEITNPYQGKTLEADMFSQSLSAPAAEPAPTAEFRPTRTPQEQAVSELPSPEPFATGELKGDVEKLTDLAPQQAPPAAPQLAAPSAEELPMIDLAPAAPPQPTQTADEQPRLLPAPGGEPAHLTPLPGNSIAEIKPAPRSAAVDSSTQTKLERIAHREGEGLKGFCPVALRDDRDLLDADPQFSANYRGETFYFSSEQALEKFLESPRQYVPAVGGNDVIHHALTGERLTGKLDHAVWYKGRLYLFSSAETMETFQSAPSSHAAVD